MFQYQALFKDFKPYRPLTGNDHGIIIGMNEISAGFLLDFHGLGQGFVESLAVEDNIGTIALGCLHLGKGGGFRHDDRGTDSVHGPAEGNALGMVAGRGCNDSALFLFRAQSHDAVRSTADLEGTCALEIFKFQVGFPVCQSGNRVGHVKGRLIGPDLSDGL